MSKVKICCFTRNAIFTILNQVANCSRVLQQVISSPYKYQIDGFAFNNLHSLLISSCCCSGENVSSPILPYLKSLSRGGGGQRWPFSPSDRCIFFCTDIKNLLSPVKNMIFSFTKKQIQKNKPTPFQNKILFHLCINLPLTSHGQGCWKGRMWSTGHKMPTSGLELIPSIHYLITDT